MVIISFIQNKYVQRISIKLYEVKKQYEKNKHIAVYVDMYFLLFMKPL